jgi:hypothetical protein
MSGSAARRAATLRPRRLAPRTARRFVITTGSAHRAAEALAGVARLEGLHAAEGHHRLPRRAARGPSRAVLSVEVPRTVAEGRWQSGTTALLQLTTVMATIGHSGSHERSRRKLASWPSAGPGGRPGAPESCCRRSGRPGWRRACRPWWSV